MSVFGVDLGSLNSVVAVTRHGGIDIVCNEVSKRETSSFVSYLQDERLIGEAGYDKLVRNSTNTISCMKRLIGMRRDDPQLDSELRFLNCGIEADEEGRLKLEVDYNDGRLSLYPEQVLAALLGKLHKYVVSETKAESPDCVISVPVWYTAEQRRLVIQACEIAGIKNLSLINETTAAAVDYGIFRVAQLPEKEAEAHNVAIVDIGYSATTITIANFWKGNMRVLAHSWDKEISTRELDYALYEHFAEEVQKKYKVNPKENRRARVRLLQGCDKLKCLLSANPRAPLNIENLMDVDVSFMCDREQLEQTLLPLCDKLKGLIAHALEKAGQEVGKLYSVEVIGGGSRIPAYKQAVSEGFGVPASFTLNASESVARGCAITAATFSPLFQVREYVVNEAPLCPLMMGYYSEKADSASSIPYLPNVNKTTALLRDSDRYPKSLELTFQRSNEFDLYAFYDENHEAAKHVPKGPRSVIGHWKIGGPGNKTTTGSVKVRVRFLANGLVSLDSAWTHETYEVEMEEKVEKKPEEKEAEPAEGSEAGSPKEGEEKKAEPQTVRVKKTKQRRLDLTVTPQMNLGNSAETLVSCRELEKDHDARDLTIQKTREVRNELEGYVYDNRSRVRDGDLKTFVTDADRQAFVDLATEIEEWLYGDGDHATLNEYQTRLDKLKVIGAAAIRRLRLSEDIPFAHKKFEQKVANLKETAAAKKGKAAHITDEEIDGAMKKCDDALAWGKSELEAYQTKPKHEDPTLAPSTFDNKGNEVEAAVKAVVNKKPPPPPKEEKKEEKKEKKEEKKDNSAEQPASPASDEKNNTAGPTPQTDLD